MKLDDRFWNKVRKSDGCWIWTATRSQSGKGYGEYWLNGGLRQAHRCAWEDANGEIPEGMNILHSCDNRACVNPAHLYLGTQVKNCHDTRDRGRQYNTKLDWPAVLTIRSLAEAGASSTDIAEWFDISRAHARKVIRGVAWPDTGGK